MKNGLKWVVAVAALLIIPFSFANAFVFTATPTTVDTVSMLSGMNFGVGITIENMDIESHNVKVSGKSESNLLSATPTIKSFELSKNQSTQITINLNADDDIENGTYDVQVKVDADGQVTIVPLTVYIGSNSFLSVNTFNKTLCQNDFSGFVSVSVKNNSDTNTSVALSSEQSVLIPFFEEDTIDLASGESQFLELALNTNEMNIGEFSGVVVAQTAQIAVIRPFVVNVKDCPSAQEKILSLKFPKKPKDLVKGQITLFPVEVTNLSDTVQDVTLFSDSVIEGKTQHIQIPKNTTATIQMEFIPALSVKAGTYPVTITAATENYSTSLSQSMKVLPLDKLQLELVQNIFSIAKGQTKNVSLILSNPGDTTQTVTFFVESVPPGINYTFVPVTYTIAPYSSKSVALSVQALSTTAITNVTTKIIAQGKTSASVDIAFDILPASADTAPVGLEFISYPQEIELVKGIPKVIEIVVKNPSEKSVLGLNFRLVNASNAIVIQEAPADIVLAPLQTKKILVTLATTEDAEFQIYSPTLVLESSSGYGGVPISVNVSPARLGFGGMFTGLASFARTNPLGFMVGIVIILVLIGLFARSRDPNPAWMGKNPRVNGGEVVYVASKP